MRAAGISSSRKRSNQSAVKPMIKTSYIALLCLLLCPFTMWGQTEAEERQHKYTPCDASKYPDNMTMVVQVKAGNHFLTDCEVAVFDAGGECRASSLSMLDHEGRCYLTIQGEEREALSFRVVYHANGEQFDVVAIETVTFETDATIGRYAEPYVLTIPAISSVASGLSSGCHVQAVRGGLILSAMEAHTFCIISLSGELREVKVLGNLFISLPVGVYVVEGKKYMVQ